MRPFALIVLLLAFTSMVSTSALAQSDESGRERARAAFERGLALVEQERWEEALEVFDESLRLHPTQSALFNRGVCLGLAGRPVEAIEALEEHRRRYGTSVNAERRARVEQELERLRHRVGRVDVRVEGANSAVVLIDGEEAGQIPLEHPIAVNPGRHQVTVRAPNTTPVSQWITVGAGEETSVVIAVTESAQGQGTVAITVDVPDAEVRLDGAVVGRSPLNEPLSTSPGRHTLVVGAEEYETSRTDVDVRAGEEVRVTITLVPRGAVATGAAIEDGQNRRGVRIGAYISTAIAVTALGAALGIYLWNGSRYDTWETEDSTLRQILSSPEPDDPETIDERVEDNNAILESINSTDVVAVVMLVAGSAATVAATVLYVLGFRQERTATDAVSVSFTPTVRGLTLTAQW